MSKLNFERLRFMNKKSDYDGSDLPRTGSYADRRRYMQCEPASFPQHAVPTSKGSQIPTFEASRSMPQLAAAKNLLRQHCKTLAANTAKFSEEQWEARVAELRRLIGFILSKEGGKEIYALIRTTEALIGRALCAHSIARERSDAMRTTTFQLGR